MNASLKRILITVITLISVIISVFTAVVIHQNYDNNQHVTICEEAQTTYGYHEGKQGVLFLKQDLTPYPPLNDNAIQNLTTFVRTLETYGTTLVILLPPDRGMLFKNALNPDDPEQAAFNPTEATTSYQQLQEQLKHSGATIIDLLEPFSNTPTSFFKREHHWTPTGANLAAKHLTKTLQINNPDLTTTLNTHTFTPVKQQQETRETRYAQNIQTTCGTTVPLETMQHWNTTTPTPPEQDLFSDTNVPPVVLIGSSFSQSTYAFDTFLKHHLGTDIINNAIPGGGIRASFEQYLLSDTWQQHKPRLIIWEIPARNMTTTSLTTTLTTLQPLATGCPNPTTQQTHTLNTQTTTLPLNTQTPTNAIQLSFTNLSIKTFNATITTNNQTQTHKITRPNRVTNTGTYYLPHTTPHPPTQLTIQLPKNTPTTLTIKTCAPHPTQHSSYSTD